MSGSNAIDITAQIASAYISNNKIEIDEISGLIQVVYDKVSNVMQKAGYVGDDGLKPAVAINESIFDEYIICLEDGQKFKSLKRHLKTHYDLTPEQYRVKWGLPADYPMVAPVYAERRSNLAKQIGLGKARTGKGKNQLKRKQEQEGAA